MRNAITTWKTTLLGLACAGLGAASLHAADEVVLYTWNFQTGANPAASELSQGMATAAPGSFGSGWLKDVPALMGRGGYWDLGRNGTLTFALPGGLQSGKTAQKVLVKVTQWWDGGIFNDFAVVTFPGAHRDLVDTDITSFGAVGGWVVDTTTWQPDSGAKLQNLMITAGNNGAVVDSVSVEVTSVTLPPPQLAIRPLPDNKLELSWPAGYDSMVLEANSDLSNPAGWQKADATLTSSETGVTAIVDASAASQFYRLTQQ